jgi:hypothetical protein
MNETTVIIALVAALGILRLVVVTAVQEATANNAIQMDSGCSNGVAINASKGRCLHP